MKVLSNKKLTISNLCASIDSKEILHGINITVMPGSVHVVMGPNGSGKSTLANVLMGHPHYETQNLKKKTSKVRAPSVKIGRTEILTLPPEVRAKKGLYLAFQSPIAIPGVSVMNLLRTAYQEIHPLSVSAGASDVQNPVLARRWKGAMNISEFTKSVKASASELSIPENFLQRGIHDGFSGGEKKKIEMLQALVLRPKFAIFDEIDTGLDVDALQVVSQGIELLRSQGTGVIVITHYQRILRYLKPDIVHILVDGLLVKTGSSTLVDSIEKNGYLQFTKPSGGVKKNGKA